MNKEFIDVYNCQLKNRLLEPKRKRCRLSFPSRRFEGGVCKVFLSPSIRTSKRLRSRMYMFNTTDHRDSIGSHYLLLKMRFKTRRYKSLEETFRDL